MIDDYDLWPPPEPVDRPPVKCRRHQWRTADSVTTCARCQRVRDDVVSRRGRNNRTRGNAIEREVARKLGLRRVGQYGGPDDASGEWLVVQVKSGGAFPERLWRWLKALPTNAQQTPAVVITDAPGPGHRRRALVVVDLESWAALHGITEDVA